MHRIFFQLGPVTIFSYGAMMVVAFLTASWLASRSARRLPPAQRVLNPAQIVDLFCLAMLSGVLGGRLFFVVQYWEVYVHQPQEIPAIWHGGLVWYGGFLGGLLGIVLYLWFHRIPVLRGIDQFIPFVALGHGIGRIGCFLNGCCFGKPTSAWFGLTAAAGEPARIPTQLLESGSLLLLFLALRRLQERWGLPPHQLARPQPTASHRVRSCETARIVARGSDSASWWGGALFGAYLVGYAVIRFFIEFLRGDQTVVWAGMTLQQLLSLGVLLGGLALFRRDSRSKSRAS